MSQQRYLATPIYLVAFALLCVPPFDALMQAIPFQLHEPRWRFGVVGLLSNGMMISAMGLLVAFIASSLFEHRRLQRVLGIVALIVAAFSAVLLVTFGLDALQVRSQVQPAAHTAFRAASATGALKLVLGIITFAAFGFASFKAPRGPRSRRERGGLIVNTALKPVSGLPSTGSAPVELGDRQLDSE